MGGAELTAATRAARGGVLWRSGHVVPTAGTEACVNASRIDARDENSTNGVPAVVPARRRRIERRIERRSRQWADVFARWDAEEANGETGKWIKLYCLALTRSVVGETERLPLMLRLFRRRPPTPEVFWGVLERVWGFVVVAWHPETAGVQAQLLELMRAMHRSRRGRTLKLYRGSTADRVCGLSWTTRRRTAVTYARAHLTKFGSGVVTTARVPARAVFMDLRFLGEAEMVIDPDQVEVISTQSIPDPWSWRT